jgi:peroxiredoxin
MKTTMIIVGAILFLIVSFQAQAVKIGDIVPDFELLDITEKKVKLSDYSDQAVLLVFGATWCPHCRTEIPQLNAIEKKYRDRGLKVLYVDVQESARKVQSFVTKHKIDYTALLDSRGTVARRYKVQGIPLNIVVGPGCKVKFVDHFIPENPGDLAGVSDKKK